MDQEKIGKFISKCRKEKKITQQELAEKLNVTDKAISKWENGRCLMDISLLKPLSECLGVTIIELINGEKIDDADIQKKSTEVVESTLNYTNERLKKVRIKAIFNVCLAMIIIVTLVFCLYKGILLYFHHVSDEKFDEVVSGLKVKNTLSIYKKSLNDNEYLVIDDMKIRNDFKDFEVEEGANELAPNVYRLKDENGSVIASLTIGSSMQYIDAFSSDDVVIMSGIDSPVVDFGQFNAADRKYFLLKNDINNDIDFLEFIRENGYLKSNILTSTREVKENYAYNLFVDIAMAVVDNITLINGDYVGYIYNFDDKDIRQVSILRNDKSYNLLIKGKNYISDEYIKDLISTLEIKAE